MNDIYYPVAHRTQSEIDSFKNRYQKFQTNLISDIFKKSLGLTATKWEPSKSWGSSHVIYFVTTKEHGKLILRANTGFNSIPEYAMLTEKLITDQVSKIGIPTNHILYVDISRQKYPFDFQIQEVLKGEDPEIDFHGTKADYDQISYELGEKIAIYQQINYDGFGHFSQKEVQESKLIGSKSSNFEYFVTCLESDFAYLIEAKVISKKQHRQLDAIINDHKTLINCKKGVLVHHDLADHNLRFKNRHLTGIFDWETAVISDPVLDLASCPTWKTLYPREEQLLLGYQSVKSLPDHFLEKKNIYVLRTMLWKMVYAIRANILNNDRILKFKNAIAPYKV